MKKSTDGAEPILSVERVTKRFGSTQAVNGLDLKVYPGQVIAVLGPNGAGKTTTMEMCEGFLAPDSGFIRVFGKDPYVEADSVRARMGVMLQGGGAYPGIRVGEMLNLVTSYHENPLDMEWLLDTVGLSKQVKTPYRRLSGGQQQRLSLACALVGRPELIFLDEPTAGLDAQSRLAVWDIIDSLRRDGVGVVLTTHLMDEAESLADYIYIIDGGSLIASGTPAEIMSGSRATSEDATARCVVIKIAEGEPDTGALAQALEEYGQQSLSVSSSKTNTIDITGCSPTPEFVAAVTAELARQGVLLRSLEIDHQSLEAVFLNLTGKQMRS